MMKPLKTLLLALCLSFLAAQSCPAQTESEDRWVSRRFPDVLKTMLPNDEGWGWRVGFTTFRDLYTDVLEYSCVFKESWPESTKSDLVVVVRMADAISLHDQMMALHRKNPKATIKQIQSKLKIKEWRLTEKSCPAVRELYSAFYLFNLPMLSTTDRAGFAEGSMSVTLHPLMYDIHAVISGGDIELSLGEGEHPFVKWADKTRSQLDACIKNLEKQNGK